MSNKSSTHQSRSPTSRCLGPAWIPIAVAALVSVLGRPGAAWAAPTSSSSPPVGTSYVHTIEYHNVADSDLQPVFDQVRSEAGDAEAGGGQAVGLRRTTAIDVRGTLRITIIGKSGPNVLVAYQLSELSGSFTVDGAPNPEQLTNVARQANGGVFGLVTPQGRVVGLWFPPSMDLVPRSFTRTLISLTQCVVPAQLSQAAWQVEEEDQNGPYLARYSRVEGAGDATGTRLRKEKLRYSQPSAPRHSSRKVIPTTYHPTGGLDVILDSARNLVTSIRGTESLSIFINDKRVGSSETSFRLELASAESVGRDGLATLRKSQASLSAGRAPEHLRVQPSYEESDRILYRQKLGTDTIQTLLRRLGSDVSAEGSDGETELYLKLKALVYLHPETCRRLGSFAAGASSRRAGLLLGALASIGHADAQDAIIAVLERRSRDADFLIRLIPLFSTLESPTLRAERALRALAYGRERADVRATAHLALGAMAKTLSDDAPRRSQKIVSDFVAAFGPSTDPQDAHLSILFLGNAADRRYAPVLLKYSHDASPEVRADAVHALRFFPREMSLVRVLAALEDPDASVRFQAANALGFIGVNAESFAKMKAAYEGEGHPEVRAEILRTVWKFEKTLPQSRELLRCAAESDSSQEVRDMARGVMSMYPEGYFGACGGR
jgi:hypothetical protein